MNDELDPDRMAQAWHDHRVSLNGYADPHALALNRQWLRSLTREQRAVEWHKMLLQMKADTHE